MKNPSDGIGMESYHNDIHVMTGSVDFDVEPRRDENIRVLNYTVALPASGLIQKYDRNLRSTTQAP